jgi:hypothetical protein
MCNVTTSSIHAPYTSPTTPDQSNTHFQNNPIMNSNRILVLSITRNIPIVSYNSFAPTRLITWYNAYRHKVQNKHSRFFHFHFSFNHLHLPPHVDTTILVVRRSPGRRSVISTMHRLVVIIRTGRRNRGARVRRIMRRANIVSRGSKTASRDRGSGDFGVAQAAVALVALPEFAARALGVVVCGAGAVALFLLVVLVDEELEGDGDEEEEALRSVRICVMWGRKCGGRTYAPRMATAKQAVLRRQTEPSEAE